MDDADKLVQQFEATDPRQSDQRARVDDDGHAACAHRPVMAHEAVHERCRRAWHTADARRNPIAADPGMMRRVASLLSEFPGHAFCEACLAERLAVPGPVAWAAATALADGPDFELGAWFCSHCLDRPRDVVHVRWIQPAATSDADRPEHERFRFSLDDADQ